MEKVQVPLRAYPRPVNTNPYNKHSNKLAKRHIGFKRLIRSIGRLKIRVPIWRTVDDAVVYSVIGQMLSAAASSSIIKQLYERYSSSKKIIEWAHKTRRIKGAVCGVSQKKRKALSEWLIYRRKNVKRHLEWLNSDTDTYRKDITSIWGFGNWSADMIGIFYLGRMNIWPESDAGLIRACRQVINTDDQGKIKRCIRGCETTAALYLWEYLDNKVKLS